MSALRHPQTRHWCFTLNNYTDEDIERLQRLEGTVTYLVFGKEVAPTTGTPHLQGYVCFKQKKRRSAAMSVIGRCHLDIKKGTPREASDYCKKEGDYIEFGECPSSTNGVSRFDGFVSWIKAKRDNGAPIPTKREIANEFPCLYIQHGDKLLELSRLLYPEPELVEYESVTLRPWQEGLYDAIRMEDPGDRKIIFYVDTVGGKGKTFFQRYMVSKYPDKVQILSSGKRDDVKHSVDETKEAFLFNVPRGGMEWLSYSTLEEIKDRMVYSPKYHSRTKIIRHKVHVIVFCNEMPKMDAMSADRYVIVNLDDEE